MPMRRHGVSPEGAQLASVREVAHRARPETGLTVGGIPDTALDARSKTGTSTGRKIGEAVTNPRIRAGQPTCNSPVSSSARLAYRETAHLRKGERPQPWILTADTRM